MSRQRAGIKAYRLLDFLTGLHDSEVSRLLQRHGLDAAEIDRGWALLRRYAASRSIARSVNSFADVVSANDEWSGRWFPVADAALAHSFPRVREWLFRNVSRVTGQDGLLATQALLHRLTEWESGKAPLGNESQPALERLRARGLTREVIAEAEAIQLRVTDVPTPQANPPQTEEAAEEAFWGWYLEWSAIARVMLKDKALLNHLGFGKVGRPRAKKS